MGPTTATRSDMFSFRLLPSSAAAAGPRLGRLVCRNVQIDTPAFIAPSSRGVVPHLTHDNLRDHTAIKAAYVALEDCTYLMLLPRVGRCADRTSSQS